MAACVECGLDCESCEVTEVNAENNRLKARLAKFDADTSTGECVMKFSELLIGTFFKIGKYLNDIDATFTPYRPKDAVYRRCRNAPAPCGGYYNAISEMLRVVFIPEDTEVARVRYGEALDHMTTVALNAQNLRDQFYARVQELESGKR